MIKNKKINKKNKIDSFLYGHFTKQNTIFTLTDLEGKVKCVLSNGITGFKNSRSKTKFATQFTAEKIGQKAKSLGYFRSSFIIKGYNKGRRKCVRFLKKGGLKILKITDNTIVVHNGCRPPKKPRL
jgi:small subunit ribosomal protein S11